MTKSLTGINIQAPWAELLINGQKTVETRSYRLPQRLEGVELAVIETPGKSTRFKSRIIGTITFSNCFQYTDIKEWFRDYHRHLVSIDSKYRWGKRINWNNGELIDAPKFGWIVQSVNKLDYPVDPPAKRGIIYARNCVLYGK
jgi:hypothetical protein